MSDQPKETNLNGLILIGKVNTKSFQRYKNGDEHFFLYIACLGDESLHRVEVKPQEWGGYQEGSPFKAKIKSYSAFSNRVTFIPAD